MEKVIRIPNTLALTRGYEGKWVVISSDYRKLLASGATLATVLKKTSDQKRKIVFRVLSSGYAPTSS